MSGKPIETPEEMEALRDMCADFITSEIKNLKRMQRQQFRITEDDLKGSLQSVAEAINVLKEAHDRYVALRQRKFAMNNNYNTQPGTGVVTL